MLLEELIGYLQKCYEEYGNVNVCVYNYCHELPCETILAEFHEDDFYVPFCEDDILVGDYLYLS